MLHLVLLLLYPHAMLIGVVDNYVEKIFSYSTPFPYESVA